MIETVAIAFVVFLLAVVGMAIGTIVTGRRLKGSCGGLGRIDGAGHCNVCGRDMRGEPDDGSGPCGEPPAGGRGWQALSTKSHRAGAGAHEPRNRPRETRLSGSGLTDDGQRFTRAERKLERSYRAEHLAPR